MTRKTAIAAIGFIGIMAARATGEGPTIRVETPMEPPAWALLERAVLKANDAACRLFFDRYFDERGYLECVARWGGDDGPDDASETLSDWPLLHALGGHGDVLDLYKKGWEGHLRQFTEAKTTEVPFARDGMYYKEFPVMFDWLHHNEGLIPFFQQGLSDPDDARFRARMARYAGFYMNEDPGAPNYDPSSKVIRSLFNGSRGPLLRDATALDWAGDTIEVEHRFKPKHGERTYQEMLDHFRDYTDVVGDHPENLMATTLALQAFALTNDQKYKQWLIEYVDAWLGRMAANGGIIPTKVGPDSEVGGPRGRWWGGVYGWGFTVIDPVTGKEVHRNQHHLGLVGFGNAYLLTGDDRYLDAWRKQVDAVNANQKVEGGRTLYPRMRGDRGWYDFTPQPYSLGLREIHYWSQAKADRDRLPADAGGWLGFLEGREPSYPERALRADLATIRRRVEGIRRDETTPDTRLADDPLEFNPATAETLVELTMGGLHPGRRGGPVHARIRHFDPVARRAGLPEDVAALVDRLTSDEAAVTLVNLDPTAGRSVVIQAGGFAEHRFTSAAIDGRSVPIDGPSLTVDLAPGAGARVVLTMRRYVAPPTFAFPWARPGA